jgi:hypothetical protein
VVRTVPGQGSVQLEVRLPGRRPGPDPKATPVVRTRHPDPFKL